MTPEQEAQEWLDATIDNINEAEVNLARRANVVTLLDEYLRWHTKQSMFFSDTAHNAALQAIGSEGGLVVFVSPDDGERCLTTGHRLQQMLQASTLAEALDATDGIVVY